MLEAIPGLHGWRNAVEYSTVVSEYPGEACGVSKRWRRYIYVSERMRHRVRGRAEAGRRRTFEDERSRTMVYPAGSCENRPTCPLTIRQEGAVAVDVGWAGASRVRRGCLDGHAQGTRMMKGSQESGERLKEACGGARAGWETRPMTQARRNRAQEPGRGTTPAGEGTSSSGQTGRVLTHNTHPATHAPAHDSPAGRPAHGERALRPAQAANETEEDG